MKAKTSITLSMQLLVKIDRMIGEGASRSAYIEKVLRDHLRDEEREAAGQRDLELINANADYLNREMEEVLKDQDAFYFDLIEGQDDSQHSAASTSPAREDRPETADERVVSQR
jgi:metal-responsive CopG/Arc/MetJ family transcriptional regulator